MEDKTAFPTETRPYIDESVSYEGYPQNAEKVNGRWAMIRLHYGCTTSRCLLEDSRTNEWQNHPTDSQAYSNLDEISITHNSKKDKS